MAENEIVTLVNTHLQGTVSKITQHGDEWRMNSPLRPTSDSMGFCYNAVTGVWKDHAGGESGNAITLAKALGIPLPERVGVANSKREYRDLADYAQQKGVPVEVFAKNGWQDNTTYDGRPAFTFKTATGIRYRFKDGLTPPFKSEYGYKRCWYGLKRAVNLAKEHNHPFLVICNGEPSVLVAQYFGIPAFALTGGENQNIPGELMVELHGEWAGNLVVALDCDKAGREGAEKYRRALTAAGYQFRIVDLGLDDKGDLADLCKLHTTNALDALLKCGDLGVKAPSVEVQKAMTLETALKELAVARKQENGRDLRDLLERVQAEIDALRKPETASAIKPIGVVLDEYQNWLDLVETSGGIIPGVPSGMRSLDEYLGGGFAYGTVTTFLAATNQGKSTLMASIASELINYAPGAIIGTETKGRALVNKIIAYRTGLSTSQIARGQFSATKRKSIDQIVAFMREENIVFLDASMPTPKQVLETAKRSIENHDCRWVIIDSLSNIGSESGDGAIFDNVSSAADVAAQLASMNLAVIATSQVGRSMKGRENKIPTMHDGKGSGRIEENADMLIALYNHWNYVARGEETESDLFPPNSIMLRMLKNRDGEIPSKGLNLLFKGGIGVYDLDMQNVF